MVTEQLIVSYKTLIIQLHTYIYTLHQHFCGDLIRTRINIIV